jgi:hypothetical protein
METQTKEHRSNFSTRYQPTQAMLDSTCAKGANLAADQGTRRSIFVIIRPIVLAPDLGRFFYRFFGTLVGRYVHCRNEPSTVHYYGTLKSKQKVK